MDDDEKIYRDGFLVAGNYFFKDAKDYQAALHQYKIAHSIKKTPLSAYMILSCSVKTDVAIKKINEIVEDCEIVAEMSEYDKDKDDLIHVDGDLSEIRFKLRKFLTRANTLVTTDTSSELSVKLKEFESKVFKWLK